MSSLEGHMLPRQKCPKLEGNGLLRILHEMAFLLAPKKMNSSEKHGALHKNVRASPNKQKKKHISFHLEKKKQQLYSWKKWSPPMHSKNVLIEICSKTTFLNQMENHISPPFISLKFYGSQKSLTFHHPLGEDSVWRVRSGKPLRIRRRQRTGQLGILVLRGTRRGRLGRLGAVALLPWKILQEGAVCLGDSQISRLVVEPTPICMGPTYW